MARRALLCVSAIFIAAAVVTAVAGDWRLDLGPIHATSSSPAKPSSIAFGLLLCAALMLPRLRAAAQRSSTPIFYALAALATWMLAWGPEPEFRGTRILFEAPFAWLMRLPGGDSVRVPARFWLLSALCLTVLMGILVSEMLKRRSRTNIAFAVAAASCGLIVDGWAWIPAHAGPAVPPRPDLMRGGVVLELPAGDTLGDVAAVYRAVTGGWRTVNGYSGYEPPEYQQIREASAAGTVALEPLSAGRTLHVLVSEEATDLNRAVASHRGSELIGRAGGLVQYRIAGEK